MRLTMIQHQMDKAMAVLGQLSPKKRIQWLTYILEAIEADCGMSERETQDFLKELRAVITARLEKGGW